LGINHMHDIVLVTGRHCSKSWVNVAFSEGQRIAEVSFEARVSGVSGVELERRRVHGDAISKLGPSGEVRAIVSFNGSCGVSTLIFLLPGPT
jgi:hypothetical protein